MMKRYRVSNDLKKYVRRVLMLFHANWRMVKDKDGQIWCITNLSSNHFHKIVQRAKCEKASDETGIMHVTFKESCNGGFMAHMLHTRGQTAYVVIDDPHAIRELTYLYGEDDKFVQERKRRLAEEEATKKGHL